MWVPITALARPSTCQPSAAFSAVVSAWKSITITLAWPPSASSARSAAVNGESISFMNTRPSRLTIPTGVPSLARNTPQPLPGVPVGMFAGRISRLSSAR